MITSQVLYSYLPTNPSINRSNDLENITINFIRNAKTDWINQKPIDHLCPYLSVMNKRHYLGLKRIEKLWKLVLISGG